MSIVDKIETAKEGDKLLYVVSIVCTEMTDSNGKTFKTGKYLPVYDSLEEAEEVAEKMGGGQIIGLVDKN